MKEDKKFWFKILILDALLLIVFFIFSNSFNFILKNQISETFSNEIRNDFLLSSQREMNRKVLNFIDHTDFYEIFTEHEIFYKTRKINDINQLLSVSIKHPIYSNILDKKNIAGYITFKYSLIPISLYTIAAWITLNLFLILFIPHIKRHLENKIIREQEVLRVKKEIELALQVSHDIRSPLAVLNSISEKLKDNVEDYHLLQLSILRINDIANNLLKDKKGVSFEIPSFYLLPHLILEIVEEKKREYSRNNLELLFISNLNIDAFIVPSEFKRILSNLLNNSIEANDTNPKIKIELSKEDDQAKLTIIDNGKGIPETVIQNLGTKSITTKANGNGLGLKHAYSTIKEWGGTFRITNTSGNGTTIEILLKTNLEQVEKLTTILIDDDDLTRATWESKAKRAQLPFQSYRDIQSFKEIVSTLDKNTTIYIDSELGEIKGETLAQELHEMGFTNLSIASGHPPERFKQFTFLKSIISKKAPF